MNIVRLQNGHGQGESWEKYSRKPHRDSLWSKSWALGEMDIHCWGHLRRAMGSSDIPFYTHSSRASSCPTKAVPGCSSQGASEGATEEKAWPCQWWGSWPTNCGGAASPAPGDLQHSGSYLPGHGCFCFHSDRGGDIVCWLALPTCPSHSSALGPMDTLHGVCLPRSCHWPLLS